MTEKIDLEDTGNLKFTGFNNVNFKNALLVFEHEGMYHFCQVEIIPKPIPKKTRMVDPLDIRIFSHDERYIQQEQVRYELEELVSDDETLGCFFIEEITPIEKPLEYKLNLFALSYVLCQKYIEDQENKSMPYSD